MLRNEEEEEERVEEEEVKERKFWKLRILPLPRLSYEKPIPNIYICIRIANGLGFSYIKLLLAHECSKAIWRLE